MVGSQAIQALEIANGCGAVTHEPRDRIARLRSDQQPWYWDISQRGEICLELLIAQRKHVGRYQIAWTQGRVVGFDIQLVDREVDFLEGVLGGVGDDRRAGGQVDQTIAQSMAKRIRNHRREVHLPAKGAAHQRPCDTTSKLSGKLTAKGSAHRVVHLIRHWRGDGGDGNILPAKARLHSRDYGNALR